MEPNRYVDDFGSKDEVVVANTKLDIRAMDPELAQELVEHPKAPPLSFLQAGEVLIGELVDLGAKLRCRGTKLLCEHVG